MIEHQSDAPNWRAAVLRRGDIGEYGVVCGSKRCGLGAPQREQERHLDEQ